VLQCVVAVCCSVWQRSICRRSTVHVYMFHPHIHAYIDCPHIFMYTCIIFIYSCIHLSYSYRDEEIQTCKGKYIFVCRRCAIYIEFVCKKKLYAHFCLVCRRCAIYIKVYFVHVIWKFAQSAQVVKIRAHNEKQRIGVGAAWFDLLQCVAV